jgi:hypothetical protein
MTISDGFMILAVLIAPFLAVFAQKQIELWRERRARKLLVFKILMATRACVLSPEHVQALNMIELEFNNSSDKAVLNAWKEYHDHLNSYPREGENQKERAVVWNQKTVELLASLLGQMGKSLGYDFDPVQIQKGAYSPEAHITTEFELQLLRRMLVELLAGKGKIPVVIVPKDEEATKQGEKFLEGVLGILEGQRKIRVEVSSEQGKEPTTTLDQQKTSEQ